MPESFDKAIEEIAKQLPIKQVYDDGLSGATKQVGHTLTDVAKSLRLALAPFQFLAAYQDRLVAFIDRAVRRVPDEQRISPPPQIIGPVLEGIRYEPEGTEIQEMFSELLSRAMDSKRVNEAHPSYPMVIRQLSPDEAIILRVLEPDSQYELVYTEELIRSSTGPLFRPGTVETDTFPRALLAFPDNLPFYMDHLNTLGLAGIFQEGNQEPLFDASSPSRQVAVRVRRKYRLTDFGHRFVQACVQKSSGAE
jgi:hypothetical protein